VNVVLTEPVNIFIDFWNKVPFISNWLFPNLSGDWEFTITWQSICNDPESGTVIK
jgi:hypothetical protein